MFRVLEFCIAIVFLIFMFWEFFAKCIGWCIIIIIVASFIIGPFIYIKDWYDKIFNSRNRRRK